MRVYVLRFILWIVVLLASLVSLAISIYGLFYSETVIIGTIGIAVSLVIGITAFEKIYALLKGKPFIRESEKIMTFFKDLYQEIKTSQEIKPEPQTVTEQNPENVENE